MTFALPIGNLGATFRSRLLPSSTADDVDAQQAASQPADAVVTRANEILGYDLGRTERLSAYQKLRERALLRSVESTGSVREDDEEAMPPSFYDSQLRALRSLDD